MITDSKPTRAKQQNPSNYQMAHECLRNADRQHLTTAMNRATIEAMAAQTYATLALVDAMQQFQSLQASASQQLNEDVLAEVSDALMDMKAGAK